jgi:hypothetical protein
VSERAAHRRQRRQAAGIAASKVIRGPVPMSAFGGKADMVERRLLKPLLTALANKPPVHLLPSVRPKGDGQGLTQPG